MPFEYISQPPLKIAVIGSGVSGLGAAHLLAQSHRVTLFEASDRLGGHARTVVAGKRGDQPVDTGFIVLNDHTYPRLTRLFDTLDVPLKSTRMGFGVSADAGFIEYSFENWYDIVAQKRNLLRPKFYKMMLDALKFNREGLQAATEDPSKSLGQLIDDLDLGDWFKRYYLLPFSGAIWSTPTEQMLEFPAASLLRFFKNHGLLQRNTPIQWKTVDGGSVQYVNALEKEMRQRGVTIRLGTPVQLVRRYDDAVWIKSPYALAEQFDRVVFACHSDQALNILEQPTEEETRLIGAIKYSQNRSVLHADASVMPKRKACWAAWTYVSDKPQPDQPIGVTYWMNALQGIPNDDLLLNSLNPERPIREELIYDEASFAHPVFDRAAIEAQPKIKHIQGKNNTWYCGAWLKHGFHEDGYSSAVDVVEDMGAIAAWA